MTDYRKLYTTNEFAELTKPQFWNEIIDQDVKIKLEDNSQMPVLAYLQKQQQKIDISEQEKGVEPLAYAIRKDIQLDGKPPLQYAIEKDIKIDDKDPFVYCFENNIEVEVRGKNGNSLSTTDEKPMTKPLREHIIDSDLTVNGYKSAIIYLEEKNIKIPVSNGDGIEQMSASAFKNDYEQSKKDKTDQEKEVKIEEKEVAKTQPPLPKKPKKFKEKKIVKEKSDQSEEKKEDLGKEGTKKDEIKEDEIKEGEVKNDEVKKEEPNKEVAKELTPEEKLAAEKTDKATERTEKRAEQSLNNTVKAGAVTVGLLALSAIFPPAALLAIAAAVYTVGTAGIAVYHDHKAKPITTTNKIDEPERGNDKDNKIDEQEKGNDKDNKIDEQEKGNDKDKKTDEPKKDQVKKDEVNKEEPKNMQSDKMAEILKSSKVDLKNVEVSNKDPKEQVISTNMNTKKNDTGVSR